MLSFLLFDSYEGRRSFPCLQGRRARVPRRGEGSSSFEKFSCFHETRREERETRYCDIEVGKVRFFSFSRNRVLCFLKNAESRETSCKSKKPVDS